MTQGDDGATMTWDERQMIARRLRAARLKAGFAAAAHFAHAAKVNPNSYYQHESGLRGVTKEAAAVYAKLLNIAPTELLYCGPLQLPRKVRIIGVLGSEGRIVEMGNPETSVSLPDHLTDGLVGFDVVGEDNFPAYHDGDRVLFRPLSSRTYSPNRVNGRDCVVQLESGELVVRQVTIQADQRATLWAYGLPPMIGVFIVAAEPIEIVLKRPAISNNGAHAIAA